MCCCCILDSACVVGSGAVSGAVLGAGAGLAAVPGVCAYMAGVKFFESFLNSPGNSTLTVASNAFYSCAISLPIAGAALGGIVGASVGTVCSIAMRILSSIF
jgi:outer membrane lipoprotein SlyB